MIVIMTGINNGKYWTKGLKIQYTYLIIMYKIRDRKIKNNIRANEEPVLNIIRAFVSLGSVII